MLHWVIALVMLRRIPSLRCALLVNHRAPLLFSSSAPSCMCLSIVSMAPGSPRSIPRQWLPPCCLPVPRASGVVPSSF